MLPRLLVCLYCTLNDISDLSDLANYNRVIIMVFNATFNNIPVISWRSVLLVEETEVPRENHRSSASR